MISKKFLLFGLAFAIVLLIASEIADAKELASNHESEVEHAKNDDDDDDGDGNGGGSGGSYPRRRRCWYGCCGGYYYGRCRCCSTLAEATAYKQAHEAQTHN
ncbi:hypothetical protein E3N88_34498 [Mikania micrantha]|uniref:Glycine-rich protein n=1 Tax=Mikania micrantha TaxID=192012 RepID=A0A5N6LYG0_9ASTR|nr:hypothetical protein E3N88_34498 [Mikania micrantha]